jgi:cyclopropane fatty-acyl-phospholipid synthase-like methyltransferase
MSDIKSMKLYTHVERIENELAELGHAPADDLTVDELSAFDQLHYHGTEALDHALQRLSAAPGQHWLEIGSGIGGPARYLAQHGQLQMTALELQSDQNELATQLTRRCNMSSQVDHLCGDFLNYDFAGQTFDAVVSWLALYHIPERPLLLERCHQLLKPGGYFYTEDLCSLAAMDATQLADLERDLYAITLPRIEAYRRDLEGAGFEVEHCDDMSADWSEFTRVRLSGYRAERARHVRVHDEATVQALDDFYHAVDHHFGSGKLGGLRLCARRKRLNP